MRVSVAVINYNYGRYLGDALESALAQTRSVDEIVVVDDGSTDDSRQVLAGFADPVRVILSDNRGPAAASTRAIAECTGDIILQLDSDDLMAPDRVERVVTAYEQHVDAAWVFHRLEHVSRTTLEPIRPQPTLRGFDDGFHDLRAAVRRGRLPVTLPATSGLSWRRAFVQALLPIPSTVKVHDNYLKFASLATGPGVFLDVALGSQGLHDANFYASKTGKELRLTRARNALSMLPGFRGLGEPLEGMWNRSYADAWVLSRGTRDLDDDERRELRGALAAAPLARRLSVAVGIPAAALRALRP